MEGGGFVPLRRVAGALHDGQSRWSAAQTRVVVELPKTPDPGIKVWIVRGTMVAAAEAAEFVAGGGRVVALAPPGPTFAVEAVAAGLDLIESFEPVGLAAVASIECRPPRETRTRTPKPFNPADIPAWRASPAISVTADDGRWIIRGLCSGAYPSSPMVAITIENEQTMETTILSRRDASVMLILNSAVAKIPGVLDCTIEFSVLPGQLFTRRTLPKLTVTDLSPTSSAVNGIGGEMTVRTHFGV